MKKFLVALVVLAAAGGLAVVLRGPAVRTGGPVVTGAITHVGQPIDVGVDESVGYILWNTGTEPAVLEWVRVVGITGPIEVLGVMASIHTGDRGSLLMLQGFPPPEYPSKPLAEEHVVPVATTSTEDGSPRQGLQLVVGIRATGEGIGRIKGIEFSYRVGTKRYHRSYDGEGVLCVPQHRFYNPDPAIDATLEDCSSVADAERFADKFVEFRVPGSRAS